MKRSHWFFNCSTPEARHFSDQRLKRQCNNFMKENTPLYKFFYAESIVRVNRELLYLARVEQVLQRERELQTATVLAVNPKAFDPKDILRVDCNVLRTWPDKFLDELIPFFDYKAALCKDFSMRDYKISFYESAGAHKYMRRLYEQASIKLKRERDRRKRVYNLS